MRGVDDQVQQLVVGCVDVEHVHARGRHHHIAGRHVGDADHAFEHDPRFGVDDVVVLGVGEGLDQFILGVRPGVDELRELLQETAFVFVPQAALRPATGGVVGH
ncbi:hypothetical protein D9M69_550010 [compost metagenome]